MSIFPLCLFAVFFAERVQKEDSPPDGTKNSAAVKMLRNIL